VARENACANVIRLLRIRIGCALARCYEESRIVLDAVRGQWLNVYREV